MIALSDLVRDTDERVMFGDSVAGFVRKGKGGFGMIVVRFLGFGKDVKDRPKNVFDLPAKELLVEKALEAQGTSTGVSINYSAKLYEKLDIEEWIRIHQCIGAANSAFGGELE